MHSTKAGLVFCCKPDSNEGYCQDGNTHGLSPDGDQLDIICSPPSFVPDPETSSSTVLTGNRNHQMFAYCPKIDQRRCGFPDGTVSKDMSVLAVPEEKQVNARDLKYL